MGREIIDDMNSGKMPICPIHKTANYWYGDYYCRECQQEEEWCAQNAEADFYNSISLCLQCCNYSNGWCDKYPGMYVEMFGRKRKCKHFDEYVERRVIA